MFEYFFCGSGYTTKFGFYGKKKKDNTSMCLKLMLNSLEYKVFPAVMENIGNV